jgi:hypothetical protein
MHRKFPRVLALAGVAALGVLAVAGCGSASKIAQPAPLNLVQATDVASQVGTLVFADGASSPVPAALMAPGGPDLASIRRAGPMSVAAETTLTRNGVAWDFTIHWFDAQDVEQAVYDPQTTVRMQAASHASGTFVGPNGSATLGTSGTLDVTGISVLQDTLTTNSARQDTLTYSAANLNGTATWVSHATGSFVNVVEAKPVAQHYAARGLATWSVEVSKHVQTPNGSADEHFVAAAVVTFNGTHLVPLVVNGTWVYMLDLDTGHVTPVAS